LSQMQSIKMIKDVKITLGSVPNEGWGDICNANDNYFLRIF